MIDDAFKLTLDILFPKPEKKEEDKQKNASPGKKEESSDSEAESESDEETIPIVSTVKQGFSVSGYTDEESMWYCSSLLLKILGSFYALCKYLKFQ